MHVDAKRNIGPHKAVLAVRRDTREQLKYVFAANTDEGWFDQYVTDPVTGKLVVENGKVKTQRVTDIPFDLVDKATGLLI